MSGGEAYRTPTGQRINVGAPVAASKEDVASFIETGYAGASQLYDAQLFVGADQPANGAVRNKQGQDISNVWGDFQTWLQKQKESKADHEAYIAAKAGAPGRDSTIVGFNQEKQGTVLGSTNPYGKTVLG